VQLRDELARAELVSSCPRKLAALLEHPAGDALPLAKEGHTLYEDLGVVRSLSRPRVSNDHPFSGSPFKTAKYSLTYPERFDDFAYAEAHRHSELAFLTPATVHHGDPAAVRAQRQATMDRAYQQQPGRFVHGPPRIPSLPDTVWLNRAEDQTAIVRIPS
jgi:putative transposase